MSGRLKIDFVPDTSQNRSVPVPDAAWVDLHFLAQSARVLRHAVTWPRYGRVHHDELASSLQTIAHGARYASLVEGHPSRAERRIRVWLDHLDHPFPRQRGNLCRLSGPARLPGGGQNFRSPQREMRATSDPRCSPLFHGIKAQTARSFAAADRHASADP